MAGQNQLQKLIRERLTALGERTVLRDIVTRSERAVRMLNARDPDQLPAPELKLSTLSKVMKGTSLRITPEMRRTLAATLSKIDDVQGRDEPDVYTTETEISAAVARALGSTPPFEAPGWWDQMPLEMREDVYRHARVLWRWHQEEPPDPGDDDPDDPDGDPPSGRPAGVDITVDGSCQSGTRSQA